MAHKKQKTRRQKMATSTIGCGDSEYAKKIRSGNNMYSHLFKKRVDKAKKGGHNE